MPKVDPGLLDYATPRQREVLEALEEHGSQRKAAAALGVSSNVVPQALAAVKNRAARAGYAPVNDWTHVVPDGYKVRGVSTLYDGDGKQRAQWVKSAEDRERREEMLREMAAGFADALPRAEPTPAPSESGHAGLLAAYPVGDHHLGLYAWHEDSGGDYDLRSGEQLLSLAFERLSASLPPAPEALVVLLGDFFHYDSLEPVTPTARNQLDSDGRYAKMVRVAVRSVRSSLATALRRHARVKVVVQAGNHDPSSSLFLATALEAVYEAEPRVEVDTSPRQFHYHEHGACLVGVCHGHEVRQLKDLPLVMAADRPEAWGRTRHRYFWTGHVHHDRVVEVGGVRVESFRVLPPGDAWSHGKGYRAGRDMKAILLHRDHGEVQRVTVNPGMFEG